MKTPKRKDTDRHSRAGTQFDTSEFVGINRKALSCAPAVLSRILPGGHAAAGEYIVRNPKRSDRQPGSFKISMRHGRWADFACGDSGGDLISLVAYLEGVSQFEAAQMLAQLLGIQTGGRSNG